MAWTEILRFSKVNRNGLFCQSIYHVLLLIFVGYIYIRFSCACTEDPKDDAFSCFKDYSTQKLNLDRSERQLYSGTDVETLRAFCSSFISAMACISELIETCPADKYSDIEMALINFQEFETVLANLCKTEDLYEKYAQYQTCFYTRGLRSEKCFELSFNSSMTLMSSFEYLSTEEICGKLQITIDCIRRNIIQGCGHKAADLVELLVRPMVRQSNSCDIQISKETYTHQQGEEGLFPDDRDEETGPYSNSDSHNYNRFDIRLYTFFMVLLVNLQTFS
ncbi:hypothetical protein CHS0354_032977 [Potamilus streckersoni]|uniref:DUF19 domain-containing protein n=1 Tax=Potamilus streckersoni TaxID=2493646 RepID=A0AAE0VLH6_9BIVA|nr:hypothetical protein CHS0354_032977 [Potamilus streckersoni]